MSTIKHASVVLVRNKDNPELYLAVSRKDNQNDFGLPGGKVELGESYIDAAIRETREETGIKLVSLKYVYSAVVPGEVDYFSVAYVADYEGDVVQRKNEGLVRWVFKDALLNGSFGAFNKALLEVLDVD